jgi:catechol 2,3-dioxygenase-like lactoylglutathione lyase family enzyme
MTLNHLNLTVPDVSQTKEFFETYFGLHCIAERGRNAIAVMQDETGFVFTLSNFEHVTEVTYPGAFHIGFMQESRDRVDAMYERLKADGLAKEPPREFHGAWTFYLHAPGGILVEVGHQHRPGDG